MSDLPNKNSTTSLLSEGTENGAAVCALLRIYSLWLQMDKE